MNNQVQHRSVLTVQQSINTSLIMAAKQMDEPHATMPQTSLHESSTIRIRSSRLSTRRSPPSFIGPFNKSWPMALPAINFRPSHPPTKIICRPTITHSPPPLSCILGDALQARPLHSSFALLVRAVATPRGSHLFSVQRPSFRQNAPSSSMKGKTTLSTPQPPSADQLAAVRLSLWRQNAVDAAEPTVAPILTVEAARQFVSTFGLVLFAPRPQHINSPAPSLVEATLAVADHAPSIAASGTARTLLAQLSAEGSAVPLNLLGAPTTTPDAPDFVASAATFPYIFTLRGDKAWKQPPATSGATKVTPLALNTYTLLLELGPSSASDLALHLGKEITEAAVLRALSELWQHLRVLPVPHPDSGPTLWETIGNRFTKQLKAGANAGQPSALSALISLYLSQAVLATEADIETFLSPLAPRSRVRDVLHALTGARQLETIAVEGKTHLHIHGDLPNFTSLDLPSDAEQHANADASIPSVDLPGDGSRIKKFIPPPRKIGTGRVERAKPFGDSNRAAREARVPQRGSFDRSGPYRQGPPSDPAARRPFAKPAGRFGAKSADRQGSPNRPSFNKPWEEDKLERATREAAQRPPVTGQSPFQDVDLDATASPAPQPSSENRAPRRPFSDRARSGGDRPAFSRTSAPGGARPAFSRDTGGSSDARPPRREFAGGTKPSFKDRKPSFDDRKPPSGGKKPFGKPAFGARRFDGSPNTGQNRPAGARPSFPIKERRPFRRDDWSGEGRPPRREFTPRAEESASPPSRDFPPRSDVAGRPPREGFSKPRTFRDRSAAETPGGTPPRGERPAFRKFDAPRKPFAPREGADSRPPRRDFDGPARPAFGARKLYSTSRPVGSKREGEGYAGNRDAGGFASKKPFGTKPGSFAGKKPFGTKPGGFAGKKPFPGKPAGPRGADAPSVSTFDKFKGGNKPWGKRPPGRKPKPDADEA